MKARKLDLQEIKVKSFTTVLTADSGLRNQGGCATFLSACCLVPTGPCCTLPFVCGP